MPGPSSNITFLRQTFQYASEVVEVVRRSHHLALSSVQPTAVQPTPSTNSHLTPSVRNIGHINSLPQEQVCLQMLKRFFSGPGTPFPYLHEEAILRSYTTAKQNGFAHVSRTWLCLLNSIFALACAPGIVPYRQETEESMDSETFFWRAQALAKDISCRGSNIELGMSPSKLLVV